MVLKNADSDFSPRISPKNWLLPVLNNINTPPANPKDGDRYRVTAVAVGSWAGKENNVAIWEADSLVWRFQQLVEPQIWYDMTSKDWHYMSNAGIITQFDKIPLAISDVTGLQAALDGKAPLVHKANHIVGGSDPFIAGDLLDATAKLNFLNSGIAVGTRRGLNVIPGANISFTFADNPASERTDLTINASVGGNHALLDGVVDSDTVAQIPARGMLIIGNATPKWSGLALGLNGQIPISNGTDLVYRPLLASDIPPLAETGITNLIADLAATEKSVNKGAVNGYAALNANQRLTNPIEPLTTSSLTAPANVLTVSGLPAYRIYEVFVFAPATAIGSNLGIRINNDISVNYTNYFQYATPFSSAAVDHIQTSSNSTSNFKVLKFMVMCNTVNNTMIVGEGYDESSTLISYGGSWKNIAQVTSISIICTDNGGIITNLATGTKMIVMGKLQ